VSSAGIVHTIVADSAYIHTSIVDPGADVVSGFPNTMPQAKDILSEAEIAEIVNYLKGLK
jgi:cytochrome c oxidase subunit 2